MNKIIALILMFFFSCTFAQNSPEIYHRAKIYYNSPENFKRLSDAGIPTDHGFHKKNYYLESDFSETEIEIAKLFGFKVEISIDDIRSFYLSRNNSMHKNFVGPVQTRNATCAGGGITDYPTPVNYDIKSSNQFGGYYTYSEMLQELDDMAAQYPNLITARADVKDPTDTSTPHKHETAEGRYLQWVKMSDNPNSDEGEPQILYDAIHHAREPASLQQLIFYMWYLLENYATDDEVKAIIDNTELYFIPCVNPDGYLYNESINPSGGGLWRKNRRNHGNGNFGVDNNRNYSYITPGGQEVWNTSGTSNNTASNVYAGTGIFSEPENRAMRYFVEDHNFKIATNSHAFSELLLFPFGYALNQPTPDNSTYQFISGLMVSQNGYDNVLGAELSPAAGDSDDFMYGMLTTESGGTREKIFAMTPEIGSSFWPATSSIVGICKEMMFLNLTAANLVGNFALLEDTSSVFVQSTSATANYKIQRIGLTDPSNFTVSLNPVSTNISSVGSANNHNNLSFLQEVSGSITLNLDVGISTGDQIIYEIVINNGLFEKAETITKIFGQPTVVLDEIGNDTSTNWTTSGWLVTTEDFVSATSSITDSPNSNYSNDENSAITLSNQIDLTGVVAANLTYQAKWDIENNFDYVQIEVSINNGTIWIPQCGRYTNTGGSNQSGANNEPVYDGTQISWVLETIDLSDYLNENILIRFRLVTDNSQREDGFYFDDLQVNILEDNLGVDDFIIKNFNLYPNPVQDKFYINSLIQKYDIKIYTIYGQLIFSSDERSGNSTLDYSNYSKGVYLLNIQSENKSQSFKLIKQ